MASFINTLNAWSDAWATLVWAVVWQSTLVAAVVALASFALRRSSPGLRFWLWQIVAIKLLLMPFWTLAIPLPFLRGVVVSDPASSALPAHSRLVPLDGQLPPASDRLLQLPSAGTEPKRAAWIHSVGELTWKSWLLLSWLAVVLGQIGRLVAQRIRLGRLLRSAKSADSRVACALSEAAEILRLRREPSAVFTDVDCSPFVCGLRRPVLVLPRSLAASLGTAQLCQVLLHELAHIRRRDLVWSWLPEIARIIYFFHPVAHWISYRIRLERELACDQLAIGVSGTTAADYAATLVRVVSHSSQPAVLKVTAASTAGLSGGAMLTATTCATRENAKR